MVTERRDVTVAVGTGSGSADDVGRLMLRKLMHRSRRKAEISDQMDALQLLMLGQPQNVRDGPPVGPPENL